MLAQDVGVTVGEWLYRNRAEISIPRAVQEAWEYISDNSAHGRYKRKGQHYAIVVTMIRRRIGRLSAEQIREAPPSQMFARNDAYEDLKKLIWDDKDYFNNRAAIYSWDESNDFPLHL